MWFGWGYVRVLLAGIWVWIVGCDFGRGERRQRYSLATLGGEENAMLCKHFPRGV